MIAEIGNIALSINFAKFALLGSGILLFFDSNKKQYDHTIKKQ